MAKDKKPPVPKRKPEKQGPYTKGQERGLDALDRHRGSLAHGQGWIDTAERQAKEGREYLESRKKAYGPGFARGGKVKGKPKPKKKK